MKLLFDENLSPRLPRLLADNFPGSVHVEDVLSRGETDQRIWEYARDNGFALVSKDTDFEERSQLEGHPPKVVLLSAGNAGTVAIEQLLRREREAIEAFGRLADTSCLVLS